MTPEQLKKLLEIGDFREFVAWMLQEVVKLNTLDSLPGSDLNTLQDAMQLSIEVKARTRAYDMLLSIINPIVGVGSATMPKERMKDYEM